MSRECPLFFANFPDGRSALMLVAARLRHVAGTQWSSRRYLDMARSTTEMLKASA